jgi:hypothetical protein
LERDLGQREKSQSAPRFFVENLTAGFVTLWFHADNLVSYPERQRAGPDEAAATGEMIFE